MTKTREQKLQEDRENAKHGEFFFAEAIVSSGNLRPSPVFVISNENNDSEDIIICSCTKHPPRTDYDVPVQLKLKTSVRTNKIYTIRRSQLQFKIPQSASPDEYKSIIEKLKTSLKLNT